MTDAPQLDPETFDLDSWLEGVHRPRVVVPLYARGDLMPQIDEIVAELEPLIQQRDAGQKTEDVSLADVGSDAARIEELRGQLSELWAQYEASGVDFELTQMASDDVEALINEIEKEIPTPPFDASEADRERALELRNELSARLIVIGCVTAVGPHDKPRTSTTLTRDAFAKITQKFGVPEISKLIGQARALTYESRVDAPFSRRVSAALGESNSA